MIGQPRRSTILRIHDQAQVTPLETTNPAAAGLAFKNQNHQKYKINLKQSI
jgi:hypothetical protein